MARIEIDEISGLKEWLESIEESWQEGARTLARETEKLKKRVEQEGECRRRALMEIRNRLDQLEAKKIFEQQADLNQALIVLNMKVDELTKRVVIACDPTI